MVTLRVERERQRERGSDGGNGVQVKECERGERQVKVSEKRRAEGVEMGGRTGSGREVRELKERRDFDKRIDRGEGKEG